GRRASPGVGCRRAGGLCARPVAACLHAPGLAVPRAACEPLALARRRPVASRPRQDDPTGAARSTPVDLRSAPGCSCSWGAVGGLKRCAAGRSCALGVWLYASLRRLTSREEYPRLGLP